MTPMSDAEAALWREELAAEQVPARGSGMFPTLAAQVLAARKAAGLSQAALAARACVRQATVNDVEAGRNTDAATLCKLAEALGVALVVHPGATPPERRARRKA